MPAAVVPAVLHVVVLQRAADVLHRAVRLNGGEDLPVAQLVAEDHRHAARHAGAERSAGRPRRGSAGRSRRARTTSGTARPRSRCPLGSPVDRRRRGSSMTRLRVTCGGGSCAPSHATDGVVTGVPDGLRRVEAADLVALIVERGEQHPARLARHRQRRRDRRDAADARRDVRDAEDLAARQVQPIDVGEAVLVGDEEQVFAVGRELRIDVLAARERREDADAAGRQVVRRQLQRRELERLEVRLWAAIGREGDRLAVGRPRRLDVGVAVVRQLADRARP